MLYFLKTATKIRGPNLQREEGMKSAVSFESDP